jgi:hypothetical protein
MSRPNPSVAASTDSPDRDSQLRHGGDDAANLRTVPPIPAVHLEALVPSQDRSEHRDYGSDLAFKLFMRGAWPVIIVMFVALWVAR